MYKSVYNLKGKIFEPSDIEEMLNFAVAFKLQNSAIKDINIYVPNQNCIDSVLAGITGFAHNNNSFDYSGTVGNIYTTRTYKPAVLSDSEIILALCVDNSSLAKIEDSNSIALMLVVPEMPGQCDRWLSIHSALNFQTKSEIPNSLSVSSLADRCIGWLKDQSVNYSPLTNLSMENYIKEATNLLLMNNITSDYDAIAKQCLLRGLSHRDAYTLAKIMSATAPYKLSTNPDYKYLLSWVDDAQWERN